jgi:hypothetical protein
MAAAKTAVMGAVVRYRLDRRPDDRIEVRLKDRRKRRRTSDSEHW